MMAWGSVTGGSVRTSESWCENSGASRQRGSGKAAKAISHRRVPALDEFVQRCWRADARTRRIDHQVVVDDQPEQSLQRLPETCRACRALAALALRLSPASSSVPGAGDQPTATNVSAAMNPLHTRVISCLQELAAWYIDRPGQVLPHRNAVSVHVVNSGNSGV